MGAYIVADSSVFILGKQLEGEIITVPSVQRELKDIRSRMRLQISDVRVEAARKEALVKVSQAASETGDLHSLSSTDLELLAKAWEYRATLATDDYALQNAALHLGLKIEPVAQPVIKKEWKRTYRCPACGKSCQEDLCPICGTTVRRMI
jgi:UPF0271 protein